MSDTHERYCDGDHTARQRCNRNLAPSGVKKDAPARAASNGVSSPGPAAHPAPGRDGYAEASVADTVEDMPPTRAVDVEEMPTPSRWVTQAWEERAAAVGATATMPAPARPIIEGRTSQRGWLREHAALVAAATVGSLALLLVWRKR